MSGNVIEHPVVKLPDHRAETRGDGSFAIDAATTELPADAPREPSFDAGPVVIGFNDPDAAQLDPEPEPARLDPQRAVAEPDAPLPVSAQQRREWAVDVAGALAAHLLTLLLLLPWPLTPAPLPAPIPVTLVLEEPPPPSPQPPAPKPPPPTPRGPIASIDIGDPAAKARQPAPITPQPEKPATPPLPPAPRLPPPELVSALPKPAMMPAKPALAPPPDLDGLKLAEPLPPAPPAETAAPAPPQSPTKPPTKRVATARPPAHPLPHPGDVLGPAATRDEYLFRCEAMIRRYYGMLPAAFLGGRTGIAVLSIVILGDGTIGRIAVARSSGYPDIDERAERMVAAVRRFPPIPQWFQGDSMPVHFQLAFRNGVPL